MYACCGAPLFLLDLAPAGVAGDRPQHPGGSACSPCSGETSAVVLTMSSAPGLLSLLLVNSPGSRPCCVVPLSCTEAFHLAHSCLSGGIALHIGAHSIYSCEGEEVRPASVGRECLAAFHTYMWVYLHVPCAPSQDRLPRRAVVQCRHV